MIISKAFAMFLQYLRKLESSSTEQSNLNYIVSSPNLFFILKSIKLEATKSKCQKVYKN